MKRLGVFAIAIEALLALGGSSPAWAGHYSASFTGVVTSFAMTGFCNTDPSDFSNQCPSGTCDCIQLQGSASGNVIGRTPKSVPVTVNITYDQGAPQVGWTGEANCGPIYAAAHLHGNRDSEELDFTGSMCLVVDTGFRPQAAPLTGSWGLTDLSGIHRGFGRVTGTINLSNFNAMQTLIFTGNVGE